MKHKFICPRCKRTVNEYPAVSRVDNKTEICSNCGSQEALNDFFNFRDEALENQATDSQRKA